MKFKRLYSTVLLIAFLSIFIFANKANAGSACGINDAIQLSVHIPGLTHENPPDSRCYYMTGGLPQYIAGVYNFGLMVAGFLAMVMIMIGGFMYIAAGGNQTIIGKAKERIFNAIIGLVILLLSYTILYTINPDLVNQEKSKATLGEKLKKAPAAGTTTTPTAPATPTTTRQRNAENLRTMTPSTGQTVPTPSAPEEDTRTLLRSGRAD
ncbi:MAG: pilin [bacterium]|nr:pilin [bacterium]